MSEIGNILGIIITVLALWFVIWTVRTIGFSYNSATTCCCCRKSIRMGEKYFDSEWQNWTGETIWIGKIYEYARLCDSCGRKDAGKRAIQKRTGELRELYPKTMGEE